MFKARSITSKGTTQRYSDAVEQLHNPGDCVVVVRGVPRTIVIACPDGCGENVTVNLDQRTGKAWRKYERNGKLTIYPSVWRDTGCRAHFIVWNNRILWSGERDAPSVIIEETLISNVFDNLFTERYTRFELIADSLEAIPWEILWACNELVRRDHAVEGAKGTYRKIENGDGHRNPQGRIDIKV